jgi:hypothetical protein
MFELLDRAAPHQGYLSGQQWQPRYQKLLKTDVATLQQAFVKYGHYLDRPLYDLMKELLFFQQQLDSRYLIFPDDVVTAQMHDLDANWTMCFVSMKMKREQLIAELHKLT